jgi:solute carrier family 35 protein F1/2
MAPHNQSRLHAKRSEEAEDEISYDKSLDSLDMSIDSQDQEVKNEANLSSSIQNGISEGLSRFFAQWRILLLGQFLSILLACSGAISASMHFNCNISAPTMQTAMVFFLMSFHALPLLRRNTRRRDSNDSDAEEHNNTDDTTGTTNPNPTMQNGLDLGGSVSIDSTDIFQSNSMKTFNNNNPDEAQKPHSTCCGILPLTVPWWAYAAFACILVEASFFTFLALRYTTLPSAALLDNTNILAAMIGSRLILNRRYSATHIFGAMICCVGVFLNITSDWKKSGEDVTTIDDDLERIEIEEYPKRLLGDCIAIIGGLLVGLCDVVIELVVKDFVSVNEYLGTFH